MSIRWVLAALLVFPGAASASIGASWSPPSLATHGYSNTDIRLVSDTVLPTLDIRMTGLDLQFHVMDLLAGIASGGDIVLGANGYLHTVAAPISGGAMAVFHPGAQVDVAIINDAALIQLAVAARVGVEVGEGPGLGVYVIPDLGVVTYRGESSMLIGAGMGFSVWY